MDGENKQIDTSATKIRFLGLDVINRVAWADSHQSLEGVLIYKKVSKVLKCSVPLTR